MVDFVKLKKDSKEDKGRDSRFSIKRILLYVLIFMVLSSILSSITMSLSPKIAVVPIKDVIMTQESNSVIYGKSLSSRDIANTLYAIKEDNSIKAVLLDINSPGGSPVGSEEIALAIESLREEKPVYALISDTGASGAYWIAASADKIYASKMSIVGSIGVTSAGLGFEDFIKQYNISYRRQTAGEFKDIGSPFREPTQKENEMLQEILDEIHKNFIEQVANGRDMTYDQASEVATGEIFLGSKALELGLIDEIGHYKDVIAKLENITNSSNLMVVDYGPTPSFFDEIGLTSNTGILAEAENNILLK